MFRQPENGTEERAVPPNKSEQMGFKVAGFCEEQKILMYNTNI